MLIALSLLALSLTTMIHAATHSLSRVIRSPLPVVYVSFIDRLYIIYYL